MLYNLPHWPSEHWLLLHVVKFKDVPWKLISDHRQSVVNHIWTINHTRGIDTHTHTKAMVRAYIQTCIDCPTPYSSPIRPANARSTSCSAVWLLLRHTMSLWTDSICIHWTESDFHNRGSRCSLLDCFFSNFFPFFGVTQFKYLP